MAVWQCICRFLTISIIGFYFSGVICMNASLCYFSLIAELLSCSKFRILEEILTIEIKPGWKRGTKITFPEKGNEEPGKIPADVSFLIEEKQHALYKRMVMIWSSIRRLHCWRPHW